ncbi:Protein kinase domain-containing protein [Mycena sanguinolenta]|uniref:Protein kinase domain-containing protein n=1 Tax=Mycena sanguinolenta TaxID=230812 RepID=A0A8H6YAK3_9AGAR|nr:Protein kinase domain-containing protein [Mycena sanguinolenta]
MPSCSTSLDESKTRNQCTLERVETFRPTRPVPPLPSKYSGLTSLFLPPIVCRATSTHSAPSKTNFSEIFCSFPDDKLQVEVLTRFENWVQTIGDPDIPQAAHSFWEDIVDMIQTDDYASENWVLDLYGAIRAIVSLLIKAGTAQRLYVANAGGKGEKTLCVMEKMGNSRICLSGVPMEFKQNAALLGFLGEYVQGPNPIHSTKTHKGGYAIMAKLDMHRQSFQALKEPAILSQLAFLSQPQPEKQNTPPRCCYGAVFSGTYIVLVQWVQLELVPLWKAMRHSRILDIGSIYATEPLFALLIGMLLPADVVPLPNPDLQSQGFKDVEEAINVWSGHGGGGNGGGGAGTKRGPPSDSDGRPKKRRNTASGQCAVIENKLELAIKTRTVKAMNVEFADGSKHLHCPVYAVAEALKLLTGKLLAEAPELVKRSHNLSVRFGDNPLTAKMSGRLPSKVPDTVWRGEVDEHLVVLKICYSPDFGKLANELGAYERLAKFRPKIVAAHGVIVAPNFSWAALLMEDSGETVASSGGWAALPWSECQSLFHTVHDFHKLGIEHGDIAARNVLLPSRGGTSIADFGEADLKHRCQGWMCPELEELRCILAEDE